MNNNELETQAKEILEIGEKIYKHQKVMNPHAILSDDEKYIREKDKIVGMIYEDQQDYFQYHFNSTIAGLSMEGIIKKRTTITKEIPSNYAVVVALEYEPNEWFAKIRIEYHGYDSKIQISGYWGGRIFGEDYDDENLLETEKPQDLEKYLNQIKCRLEKMYTKMKFDATVFDNPTYNDILEYRRAYDIISNKVKYKKRKIKAAKFLGKQFVYLLFT